MSQNREQAARRQLNLKRASAAFYLARAASLGAWGLCIGPGKAGCASS